MAGCKQLFSPAFISYCPSNNIPFPYSCAAADVEAARELHARWLRRSEAVDRLDTVVEAVRQYTLSFPLSMLVRGDRATDGQDRAGPSSGGSGTQGGGAELKPAASGRQGAADASPSSAPAAGPTAGGAVATAPQPSGSGRSSWSGSVGPGGTGSGAGGAPASGTSDLVEWEAQVHVLEAAINEAKDANVGVSKAKRLLKEMQVGGYTVSFWGCGSGRCSAKRGIVVLACGWLQAGVRLVCRFVTSFSLSLRVQLIHYLHAGLDC